MYGHDYAPMEGFFAKADGWLSGMPAIFPKFARTLFDICTIEKDIDKANEYWTRIQPFVDYFITYNTCLLYTSIRQSGTYDLILCGKQTTDGDTAQVGACLLYPSRCV